LFARGQYKKAIHCWMKTVELEPSHPQINYHIAQALWAEGETERCRQHFLKELRINPGDVDAIIDFGFFLLERGEIESAKEKFHRALELRPDTAMALFYLGEISLDSGDKANAMKFYAQSLERDAMLAGPRYRLGHYALELGELDKAKTMLASEIKLAGDNADVLVSMASMFLIMAEKADGEERDDALDYAANCLLHALDIDSDDADAHYYLGLANVIKGRPEDAVEFFTHAMEINPHHVLAIRDSAVVYLEMNRLADAAETLERGALIVGDHPQFKDIRSKVRRSQITKQLADLFGHKKH